MGKKKLLSIIKAANAKQVLDIEFNLPLDGKNFKVTMTKPDNMELAKVQEIAKSRALAEGIADGLDKYPVNESKWAQFKEQSIKNITNREQRRKAERDLEKEKPVNLAEQMAVEASWYETANKIIPGILYSDGEPLFETDEELGVYRKMIKKIEIFSLLMGKFTEIMTQDKEAGEAVKN